MMPMESAAIIRGLLRVQNTTDALEILDDELSLPLDVSQSVSQTGNKIVVWIYCVCSICVMFWSQLVVSLTHFIYSIYSITVQGLALDTEENKDLLKHRALSLASIASRHFFEGKPSMAVKACQMMTELGPTLRSATLTADELGMPWQRIINGAAQCESGRRDGSITPCKGFEDMELPCNLVYSVLNAMTTFPSENNDGVFEALSNALVRRVLFVTGAVAMSGCPPADRGEAVFIGRSNVGKSSLVNMVRQSFFRAARVTRIRLFANCWLTHIHSFIHSCDCRLPTESLWPTLVSVQERLSNSTISLLMTSQAEKRNSDTVTTSKEKRTQTRFILWTCPDLDLLKFPSSSEKSGLISWPSTWPREGHFELCFIWWMVVTVPSTKMRE
jgi:hypothetical protein